MKINRRSVLIVSLTMVVLVAASTRLRADTGNCGSATTSLPFTDVPGTNVFFCSIASVYFTGLTNGTTATTYSPSAEVPREQMAAFVSRTLDQSIKRGSNRAALNQFWKPVAADSFGLTPVGNTPFGVVSDGADLWVTNFTGNSVSRVQGSDGRVLETWTGATAPYGVLAAKGRIFVGGDTDPGRLYMIDPKQAPGVVTTLTSSLGGAPLGIAFDGSRVWTANALGSVSIVTLNPVSVNTVTTGFLKPFGIIYDGSNIWVTDAFDDKLKKLDAAGNIVQSVTVGDYPEAPVFDGTNIWVPNYESSTVTVVRAATGAIIATLSGNGLDSPNSAAFDGERILITNFRRSVSLWKASDLSPLGSVATGPEPIGSCSDGVNFWITLPAVNKLARF